MFTQLVPTERNTIRTTGVDNKSAVHKRFGPLILISDRVSFSDSQHRADVVRQTRWLIQLLGTWSTCSSSFAKSIAHDAKENRKKLGTGSVTSSGHFLVQFSFASRTTDQAKDGERDNSKSTGLSENLNPRSLDFKSKALKTRSRSFHNLPILLTSLSLPVPFAVVKIPSRNT